MKKTTYPPLTAFAIALTLIFPRTVLSQDVRLLPGEVLPGLENVQVNAMMTREPSGILRYSYAITNPGSNIGEIWLVGIDITKPVGGIDVGSEGITNGPGFSRHNAELVLSTIETPLVPVGLFSPPG